MAQPTNAVCHCPLWRMPSRLLSESPQKKASQRLRLWVAYLRATKYWPSTSVGRKLDGPRTRKPAGPCRDEAASDSDDASTETTTAQPKCGSPASRRPVGS